jgi:hypothetical protein
MVWLAKMRIDKNTSETILFFAEKPTNLKALAGQFEVAINSVQGHDYP